MVIPTRAHRPCNVIIKNKITIRINSLYFYIDLSCFQYIIGGYASNRLAGVNLQQGMKQSRGTLHIFSSIRPIHKKIYSQNYQSIFSTKTTSRFQCLFVTEVCKRLRGNYATRKILVL